MNGFSKDHRWVMYDQIQVSGSLLHVSLKVYPYSTTDSGETPDDGSCVYTVYTVDANGFATYHIRERSFTYCGYNAAHLSKAFFRAENVEKHIKNHEKFKTSVVIE